MAAFWASLLGGTQSSSNITNKTNKNTINKQRSTRGREEPL
jgi:hypothetical protein